ncbi:S4 domain-containing protein YaaA [Thermohalobacter berrensis]|uniref:RNA-binding protein n=1 Tax=Thermohalobacter berrensis TaxID=99594 RepID=A0A419T1R6_9FIRM|nr:S4 domain-containing protein YaaA [Thermohalobacter berrensis]RKD31368.1 RNA-binding protein [Thermohalobacter berrensis]
MEKVKINSEYIKLDQLLKYVRVADTGGQAKFLIKNGQVKVNGEIVFQRGKKLRSGDEVEVDGKKYTII